MRSPLTSLLEEVGLQLERDEQRGCAPLAVRAKALRAANAAGDLPAERQALIDLAATCLARAAALPAPRVAIRRPRAPLKPARLGPRQIKLAREMHDEAGKDGKSAGTPSAQIAAEFGVSRRTIDRRAVGGRTDRIWC